LTSSLENLGPTRVKLTLEIPFADLKPALEQAYREIAAQISVPGFRKGKVPPAVINQRVGRQTVLGEAVNAVLPDVYGAAIVEHDLAPLSQPEIELVKLVDGETVEFTAEVDIRPDFELPDFATIAVTVDNTKVDDQVIDERIDLLRERFATTVPVERPAAAGDQITFDLAASQDGQTLADGTAQGVTHVVGSGGLLDGLDEAVTGLAAGQTKTFRSTLVGGAHEGEEADVEVSLTKVAQRTLPEVDDDFAQLVSQFDTVDEMRADLLQSANQVATLEQADQARDKIIEAVLDQTPFELPAGLVAREVTARTDRINESLQRAGLTLTDYLTRLDADSDQARTPEEFWADLERTAERSIRTQVVLDKLADEVKFNVDQSDLTALLFRKAQENGTSPQQELQHMQEHNHLADWMTDIRRSKALEHIVTQAEATDADGDPLDLSILYAKPDFGLPAEPEAVTVDSSDSASSPDSADSPDSALSPASAE
jgi:trigger factor